MNNERIAKYVQNIFHLENMTADDDSYNKGTLYSNSWGNGITIRWVIRDFGDEKEVILRYDYSLGSYSVSIDSGMTSNEASKEIVELIGRVLITQADTVDPNTGMNNILSWPYNCNLAYLEYLIEALQYGDNEIKSSRKPIKSSVDETELLERGYNGYQVTKDDNGAWCVPELDLRFWAPDELESYMNDNYPEEDDDWDDEIDSSMQGQERGIQAIMDEYGCSREEAIEIMNNEVTSGCHGKAKKRNKKEIKSSDTEIESSTERNTNNLNKIFG